MLHFLSLRVIISLAELKRIPDLFILLLGLWPLFCVCSYLKKMFGASICHILFLQTGLYSEPLLLLLPSVGSEGETCYYLCGEVHTPPASATAGCHLPACPHSHLLLCPSLSDSYSLVCFGSEAREVSLLLLHPKSADF